MRLAVATGRTLAEMEALLRPGELNLYAALGLVDGPWHGAQDDILHARLLQVTAAATGAEVSVARCLPPWAAAAACPVLIDFAGGVALLAQRLGG